jgi:hypothetical protein
MIKNSKIKELCIEAHKNSVEFYLELTKSREIKESNEQFIASHVANVFAKNHDLFASMETNRSLIELSVIPENTGHLKKDRDNKIEVNQHRFDVVVWNEKKPLIVFEIKVIGRNDLLENDIERLWYLQRRLGARHDFKCVFMYSNWYVKNGKASWESKLNRLKEEGYEFDAFFEQFPTVNFPNWCAGLIIEYKNIAEEFRL